MVVLQTSNLKNFTYAANYKSPVMAPPITPFVCKSTYNTEFDENYSSPGSVVQDAKRPNRERVANKAGSSTG